VWQFVSVLTLGRQNREVLNVFVSSDGGTSNSRRARERESLRHICVALIIQVKLYLTFFFFKKKKKEFCLEGTAPVRPHVSSPFIFFKKNETGGSRKQRHGTRICLVTWSRLLTILSASFS
jgi:hypothetical protein